MQAIEFITTLTPEPVLTIPQEVVAQLPQTGQVRVIVLTDGNADDAEWRLAGYEQFMRDDAAEDAAPANGAAGDYDPDALNRMIAKMTSRTPEEKLAARQRAIAESRPQIELAPDVSFFDVIPVVRGDETDEEVIAALKELS